MIYKFKNKKLYDLLKKKGEIVDKGRELSAQKEEIDAELNKCGLQVTRLQEKMQPIVGKLMKSKRKEMDEFEEIGRFQALEEKDEIEIETFNVVDAFKENYLEQKKEQK